jgi:cytochrome bd-type quinol oxidase subunit 2
MHLAQVMALVAGLAVGIWIGISREGRSAPDLNPVLMFVIFAAGGLALAGPILILAERRRLGRCAGSVGVGRLLWFATGTAGWLMWPPIVYRRLTNRESMGMNQVCYFYGTPLMAVFLWVTFGLSGWLRPRARRRFRKYWTERFGFWLGVVWFLLGGYLLGTMWWADLLQG